MANINCLSLSFSRKPSKWTKMQESSKDKINIETEIVWNALRHTGVWGQEEGTLQQYWQPNWGQGKDVHDVCHS